ncbi:subtilisin-like serine protease [Ligilactobacillus salitolerans]|uniref:Subtilisin-like serine protease n=1 Tax=Ligilactobacillus salitolerans TaxID=1808352 RepID=A0A401ISN1_9LACO|nr:S8 family peptidase [Ligilactobacillus salitolerans]GBG94539.1 subtilisin-like serine protease [Ligilactobacillus salitolerans]
MNQILELKGRFEQRKSSQRPGAPTLPQDAVISLDHFEELIKNLLQVQAFWTKQPSFIKPLVSVYYDQVIAKSNRIQALLVQKNEKANGSIVGAKFTSTGEKKHIITHCVTLEAIQETITRLETARSFIQDHFGDEITNTDVAAITSGKIKADFGGFPKTKLARIIVDTLRVEKFGVEQLSVVSTVPSIVTIYDTGVNTVDLLQKVGLSKIELLDRTTMRLQPGDFELLQEKAPYLISMSVSDIAKLSPIVAATEEVDSKITIPAPNNEPIVGVIDTVFDQDVYFSSWVDYHNLVSEDIPDVPWGADHGTAVTSIIVDGPSFNPELEDGCGRFRVRHFGVTNGDRASSFSVIKAIKQIIAQNKDIKVWNLSLGSMLEVNDNFISPEAAILDQIEYEQDVIFIISGTNKPRNHPGKMKIGAPADSINSIVVNSVDSEGNPALYSRDGIVLSFFTKPDVSYFGGDQEKKIKVCTAMGTKKVTGTSFAAPWITRKVAYLIEVMGFSRELSKALIVDAARGWHKQDSVSSLVGFGVVPQNINEILHSANDEIRFVLNGVANKYETYNYNLPVPLEKGKHPFVARATLCYFPECNRNQGVDYTDTELDLHFGRVTGQTIQTINDNIQAEDGRFYLGESKVRLLFRKWDNVKSFGEKLTSRTRPRKSYQDSGIWGFSLKMKNRLQSNDGNGIKFGIVVTLKEIHGKNRIEDFIQQCSMRGWLVNRIDVENQVEIYNQAEEVIDLD